MTCTDRLVQETLRELTYRYRTTETVMKSGDLAEIQDWFQQKHGQYFTGSICVVKERSVLRSCIFYGLISIFICTYGIPLWGTASNSNIEI